jgi:hypothetical protein
VTKDVSHGAFLHSQFFLQEWIHTGQRLGSQKNFQYNFSFIPLTRHFLVRGPDDGHFHSEDLFFFLDCVRIIMFRRCENVVKEAYGFTSHINDVT